MRNQISFHSALLFCLIVAAFLTGSASAKAANDLPVRLVLAQQRDEPFASRGLRDVSKLLRQNLRYNSYRLLQEKTITPKSGSSVSLRKGLKLAFFQVNGNVMKVRILQKDQELVSTRLTLRPRHPLVLGGFHAGDNGILIIILGRGKRQ